MKKFFILLCLFPLIASCDMIGNDDEIHLEDDSIVLYVGDSYTFNGGPIEQLEFYSGNEFVASVSGEGEITAEHVGSTVVRVSDKSKSAGQANIEVEVKSRNNLISEAPIFDFGMSKSEVIKLMGTPDYTYNASIRYYYDNKPFTFVAYDFDDSDRLTTCLVSVEPDYDKELGEYLADRYFLAGKTGTDLFYIDAYSEDDAETLVSIMATTSALNVFFMQHP